MSKRYIEELRKRAAEMAGAGTVKKDHADYFQPFIDKSGSGSAVLRFLRELPGEDPFIRIWNHAFQLDGRWFIENCPSTLGQDCPVCEANAELWRDGNTDVVEKRKRKLYYHSNVLVVHDPKQTENDGNVFLFKYGQKVFKKILGALDPQLPDTEPMNPFDEEEGANLRLRIVRNNGSRDYSGSSFDVSSPMGDPDQVEGIFRQRQSLADIVAPHQFKSYDELKAKFDRMVAKAA